jgi:hypothetical protein
METPEVGKVATGDLLDDGVETDVSQVVLFSVFMSIPLRSS